MLWCKWRLFVILFMILREFPIVLLKYSKNSRCHHLPFLMMHHTRKIWLGGRTTAFPFWMKIWEWKGGRATWFPFSIKIRVSRWGCATLTSFFGQKSDFRAIEGEEGRATCFFGATKGRSTRAKCEQNARNMRVYPAADYTAPAPFSPSLMGFRRQLWIWWECKQHTIQHWICTWNF